MKNKRSLAAEFRRRFVGRSDCRLVDQGYGLLTLKRGPEPSDFEQHVGGEACLGIMPVIGDTIRFAAVDLDDKETKPNPNVRKEARRIARELSALELPFLVEISQSGKGIHIWLFFSEPLNARFVRRFFRRVLEKASVSGAELYPKQDCVPKNKVGNGIRLPLWNKSRFIDLGHPGTPLDPLQALLNTGEINAKTFRESARRLGVEPQVSGADRITAVSSLDGCGLSDYVRSLILKPGSKIRNRWEGNREGLVDGTRSSLLMSLACLLIQEYAPTSEVKAALLEWSRVNRYPQGCDDRWIELTVNNAYQRMQETGRRTTNLRAGTVQNW